MFPVFADVAGYPLVFPLFWGATVIFLLAMARHLRVFAAAQPSVEQPHPFGQIGTRLAGLIEYAVLQRRMFKDLRAGVMHACIFWGFILLTIGTSNIVTGGIIEMVLSEPLDGAIWTAISAMQNVVAVIVIVSILWAFWRRLVIRPTRLTLNRDALLILGMIGGVVATELLAEVFEFARYGDEPGAFVSAALAGPLRSLSPETLEVGFLALWWSHMALVAAFLVYLPFSKHLHIATAFPNIWFRKLRPRGELPAMDLEQEDATFGLKSLQDLGWKDLLDGFTCTECGRCQQACPAWNTGKPLNPKSFIMGIRHMSVAAEAGLDLIPNSPIVRETYGLGGAIPAADRMAAPIVDDAIPYEAVWDCVTCGACVEACPVLIEHVDKIVGLRRNLVLEESRFPAELAGAFRGMEGQGNPWGQPASARLDWTKGLPFEVPTVASMAADGRLEELEVLYWVGCAAAFDERNKRVARAFATCLSAAGIRFAVLGQEESCTGDPARRMGNDYVFQILAAGNVETLNRYGMGERSIVTACPHCFNSIGNEYGQLGGSFTIVHHSVYLQGLLADGRLRVADEGPASSVTFHDSCYMARYNGVIAAPRDVLGSVPGVELREMEKSGKNTFCCGAGGGRMWMEETRGTRINAERTRQALETGADTVATSCPFCMVMLKDGLADAASAAGAGTAAAAPSANASSGTVSARDIAEILADSLAPTQPAGRQLPVLQ